MKIVIVCTLYPPYILGGAEISVSLQANGLARQGHQVTVITTADKDECKEEDGVTVYRIRNKNIYWRYPQRDKNLLRKTVWHFIDIYNVAYLEPLRNILQKIRPDIINTSNLCGISVVAWRVARQLRIPTVHTLRDYYLLCPQQTMAKHGVACAKPCMVCKSFSYWKRQISQEVGAVVGISDFILQEHLRYGYFQNAKIRTVIPNSLPRRNEIPDQKKNHTVGYLGRLSPEKGIEMLCDAFLKSKHGNYRLLIAGDGNAQYVSNLKRLYEGPSLSFVGKVEAWRFLNNIDLLVVPSLWNEPFGRVVIESYAAHRPVLVTARGGLRELVEEGLGRTFDPQNPETLETSLNEFFTGNACIQEDRFEHVLEKYTEQRLIKSYLDLYQQLTVSVKGLERGKNE